MLVICEGVSDDVTIHKALNNFAQKQLDRIQVEITEGDIAYKEDVDENNCVKRVIQIVKNFKNKYHLLASDFFAGKASKAIPAMIISACMNTNPVMIYFGQELGEAGMDEEGFSGRDGRTTIFDYWTVDTVRRWRNGGKFDGKLLTEEEIKLQGFYKKLLNLCNTEKAIREGTFFDLTYANLEGTMFNEHKQYAFIRKAGKELILIVVNFDINPVSPGINIPRHAFEYLNIPIKSSYKAKDLLTGNTETLSLAPDQCTSILLEGFGGKILKIKL